MRVSFARLGLLLVLVSCQRNLVIKHGLFFGECVGYCESEIEVSGADVIYRARYIGPPQKSMPAKKKIKAVITAEVWNELSHSVEENAFMKLKDRYGCPDCADQGGEWIEIRFSDGNKKRITFDYNRPPKEVLDMLNKLQSIQHRFNDNPGILGSAAPIPNKPMPR